MFAEDLSPITTHYVLARVTLWTSSIIDLLQTPQNSWNIVREIVHLLWAYGQEGHALQKSDLKKWNGSTFYNSFFRLDEDAKGFQVLMFDLVHS
jgi:hypothetical protein